MVKNTKAVLSLTVHNDTVVAWDDLPEASRAYLAQYGMNKALQDVASGTIKAASAAWEADRNGEATREHANLLKNAAETYKVDAGDYPDGASFAAHLATAQKDHRLAAILSGDVALGSTGPRLRGLDALCRDVAVERLKAAYGVKKLPFPTEAAAVRGMVEKLLASPHGESIRAEAQRRADTTATAPDDLLDILG